MKRIKKCLAILISSIMVSSLVGCNMIEKTQAAINATVLAKVGKTEITRGEVDKLLYSTLQSYKKQYGNDFEQNEDVKDTLKSYRKQALNSLVEQEVLRAIKNKGIVKIKYTDKELKSDVDSSIKSLKEQYDTDKQLKAYLKSNGYNSESEYTKYVKDQLVLSKVAQKLVEDVKVSDSEIQSYYNKNISSYKVEPGADVTHIVFTDKTTGEADAIVARKLYLAGKSLDEIAAMDQFKNKCKKEDLGYQNYNNNSSLVAEFVNGFKDLPAGQISEPVKTSFGWHLILTSNVNTTETTQTLDQVRDKVKETVLNNKQSTQYKKKIAKYKKSLNVKTYTDRL